MNSPAITENSYRDHGVNTHDCPTCGYECSGESGECRKCAAAREHDEDDES